MAALDATRVPMTGSGGLIKIAQKEKMHEKNKNGDSDEAEHHCGVKSNRISARSRTEIGAKRRWCTECGISLRLRQLIDPSKHPPERSGGRNARAGKGFGKRGAASFPGKRVATPGRAVPWRFGLSLLLPHRVPSHLNPVRRQVVKGKRWRLLTRWVNLEASGRQMLNELFALNRRVMKAYLLK